MAGFVEGRIYGQTGYHTSCWTEGGAGGGEEANAILMSQTSSPPATAPWQDLPRNVKVLGLASLLNDTASEMIYPLLPHFLLTVLLGNRFHLGVIEGVADAVASFVKLWSGGRSDQAGPFLRGGPESAGRPEVDAPGVTAVTTATRTTTPAADPSADRTGLDAAR